ncbi:hypothetical protein MFIFM68171_09997 [Madurella fahalii]|uniref:Uncharacterized protein n=1 Tax=Madurella fahalii TaxID=1157608 RepID=A0ABQ0GPX6_9PEZI
MHEVLVNTGVDHEGDMVETLELLWDAGASLDIRSSDRELVTQREMGKSHILPEVREMFHVDHRQRYRLGVRPREYRDEGGSWGDEGYNADLSGGDSEAQRAFPSLSGPQAGVARNAGNNGGSWSRVLSKGCETARCLLHSRLLQSTPSQSQPHLAVAGAWGGPRSSGGMLGKSATKLWSRS